MGKTMNSLKETTSKTNELVNDVETTKKDATAADAALLDAVIKLIAPSLRGIAGQIKTGYKEWWVGSCPTESYTYAKARGIRLAGSRTAPGPNLEHTSQYGGRYEGSDLYLLEGLRFVEFVYEGEFSCCEGSPSSWQRHEKLLSMEEAVEKYDIELIVAELTKILVAWCDTHEKVPETYRRRALKMRALKALLEA